MVTSSLSIGTVIDGGGAGRTGRGLYEGGASSIGGGFYGGGGGSGASRRSIGGG